MADGGERSAPAGPVWLGPVDQAGLPHGVGTMNYPPPPPKPSADGDEAEETQDPPPGDTFTGAMAHGQRHGAGAYTWGASGARYEGQYAEGRRHGHGCMVFPDRSRYEGDFVADQLEGSGTYSFSNGDVYVGQFKAGRKHGQGQLFFAAQRCAYIGVWADGQFVQGTWVHRDGSAFQGGFEACVPAEGTFACRGGVIQTGRFNPTSGWVAAGALGSVDG